MMSLLALSKYIITMLITEHKMTITLLAHGTEGAAIYLSSLGMGL